MDKLFDPKVARLVAAYNSFLRSHVRICGCEKKGCNECLLYDVRQDELRRATDDLERMGPR